MYSAEGDRRCIKAASLSSRNASGARNPPITAIYGFIDQEVAVRAPST